MKPLILVGLSLLGWLVVFLINRHFYKKNNFNSLKLKLYDEIDSIIQLANDFWVNEKIESSHGDYLMLTQAFKKCRQLISNLERSEEAAKLLNKAKKHLTTTPIGLSSYSEIKKHSAPSIKKYEFGTAYLEELRKIIDPFNS